MIIRLIKVKDECSNFELDGYPVGSVLEVVPVGPEGKGLVADVNADYCFFKGEYEEVSKVN